MSTTGPVVRIEQILQAETDRSAFRSEEDANRVLSALARTLAQSLTASPARFALVLYQEQELAATVPVEIAREAFAKQVRDDVVRDLDTNPKAIDVMRQRIDDL